MDIQIILKEIKRFVWHFLPLIIATVIFVLLYILYCSSQAKKVAQNGQWYYDSPNTERVYGDQRVFDYGDQLTDDEEKELEAYIHEAEKKTVCDIVIVTLNESLENYEPEYRSRYDMTITPDKWVMVYADKFWEDNRFGYNCPQALDGKTDTGDGVLLVDNVFREPKTNKVYTWMCTTGKVEEYYYSFMIDEDLDKFYEQIDSNYYLACRDFIDAFVRRMEPVDAEMPSLFHIFPMIVGALIVLIYCKTDRSFVLNKKRINDETYMVKDSYRVLESKDFLTNKNVTTRYTPPSSSSSSGGGGGGHHVSGGGGSHGGGGHSR